MKKKNILAVVILVLLLGALMAGCRRAKPAVVSEVQTVLTTTATAPTGHTVVSVASPTPTSATTLAITPTPSPEPATPTPTTVVEAPSTAVPTSTPVPTAALTVAATSVPTVAPTAAVSGPRTHIVQPGENLFRIALYYEMSWQTLAAANGIINPNFIYPGQRLTIPTDVSAVPMGEKIHVVQPGENLFRIALKYGTTVEAIAVANDISNVHSIFTGQRLRIP